MAARRAVLFAVVCVLVATGAQARAAGPTVTAQPTVSGTASAGNRLQAETGTWTSAAAITFGYQWYRCDSTGAHCTSIHGATAAGYTLTKTDIGKTIGLTVTASDPAGVTTAYASLVGPIATAKPLLVSTAQPQITGLPIAGKPLQVTTGAWSPVPSTLSYTWQRCNANGRLCSTIAGATASTYSVASDDVGHSIVSVVQANFGTAKQQAFSTATGAAIGGDIAGPTHSARPAVSGIAQQGSQLTGSAGIWTGIGSISYAYQWYRCDGNGAHCLSIHGATKATYRSVAADAGKTLGFTVRATDSTGTAAAYASLFGPIAASGTSTASSVQPALAGSARPGATLTAVPGSWQPQSEAVTYAWQRCNANGRICVAIEGAKQVTYKVTAADVGHTLVVVETATVGTTTQSAYSTASPPVA